jgi:Kdo2-lipid IVA lauroyltransferase/acyltransferase
MAALILYLSALSQTDRPVSDLVQRWLAKLPLPVFRAAGAAFGLSLWAFASRRRHIVERNLELCFPEAGAAQRARWTRETFVSFGQTFVDRVWLWHGDPRLVEQRVALTGRVDLLEQGDAVLCFVPHFYGMDAGWTRLTLDYQRHWWTFYAPQGSPAMDRWVKDGRRRFGGPRLVSRREGIRPLLRGLKEGAALCLLPDMDLGARDSVFVPFFGHEAATVTSLHRLANATGVRCTGCWRWLIVGSSASASTWSTCRSRRAAEALQLAQVGRRHDPGAVGAAPALAPDAPPAGRPAMPAWQRRAAHATHRAAVRAVLRGAAGRLGLQLGGGLPDRLVRRAAAARLRAGGQGAGRGDQALARAAPPWLMARWCCCTWPARSSTSSSTATACSAACGPPA